MATVRSNFILSGSSEMAQWLKALDTEACPLTSFHMCAVICVLPAYMHTMRRRHGCPIHTDDSDDDEIHLKDIFKFVLLKESYILLSNYFPAIGKRQGTSQNLLGSSSPPTVNVPTLLCHTRKQHHFGVLVSRLIRAAEFLNLTASSNSVLSREMRVEIVGLLKAKYLECNTPC